MIPEEMLREAAKESLEDYVSSLERDYDSSDPHKFSLKFEKKIERLKRRVDHPVFYKTMHRVASILLVILVTGSAWITVDAEARAAFFGWVKEVYEVFFVYRFGDDMDIQNESGNYEPTWVPDGYTKAHETDTGSRITILYTNNDGLMLKFNYIYAPNETDIYVVAPNAIVNDVVVNGYPADFIVPSDENSANVLMWTDINNCAFHISAFLGEEDILKIAESIYKK